MKKILLLISLSLIVTGCSLNTTLNHSQALKKLETSEGLTLTDEDKEELWSIILVFLDNESIGNFDLVFVEKKEHEFEFEDRLRYTLEFTERTYNTPYRLSITYNYDILHYTSDIKEDKGVYDEELEIYLNLGYKLLDGLSDYKESLEPRVFEIMHETFVPPFYIGTSDRYGKWDVGYSVISAVVVDFDALAIENDYYK